MAKKDTTSDWKDWILGKKKGQAEGGQAQAEPQGGQPDSPSQTLPPEASQPVDVKDQVDQVLGIEPQPEPPVQPAPEPGQVQTPPEPPQMGPGTRTEPPPPSKPPTPEPSPPPPRPAEQPEPRPSGGRLPKEVFAHLVLLNINGEMRKARELPRFFPLKRIRTLAGRHVRAHIHLDDEATVRPEHARILYEDKDGQALFIIDPVGDGKVLVNGLPVYSGGAVLASGDLIKIGSATLIFFQKNLKN